MKINRIRVDRSTISISADPTYGIGDDIMLDGNRCTISSIISMQDPIEFEGRGVFSIAVDEPSGARESCLLINARHVVGVELVGD